MENSENLAKLVERIDQLYEKHHFRTIQPLLREAIKLAKDDHNLEKYIDLHFTYANTCHGLLDAASQKDRAISLVALLENEDVARRVTPTLNTEEYDYSKYWYTSCAYDQLSMATARLQGYNAEGMHGTVAAGIEKCQLTGKTQCIRCFRENAVQISIAADDLELAASQALYLANRPKDEAQHDRRVNGWMSLGEVRELEGDFAAALEAYLAGFKVAKEYHDPDGMRARLHPRIEAAWAALGTPKKYAAFVKRNPKPMPAPIGEDLQTEYEVQAGKAAVLACGGKRQEACKILRTWWKRLEELKRLDLWLEAGARLMANLLLDGNTSEANAVAARMRPKAEAARNWITIRQIDTFFIKGFPLNPLASVMPAMSGPFAPKKPKKTRTAAKPEADAPPETPAPQAQAGQLSEVTAAVKAFADELNSTEGAKESFDKGLQRLSEWPIHEIADPDDAWRYLSACSWLAEKSVFSPKLWKNVQAVAKRFSATGYVLGMAADVGDMLRVTEGDVAVRPTPEELEKLYRKAMELERDNARTHFGAGLFFEQRGNLGEAERCLARACRLERGAAPPAVSLARVYRNTDRPMDALDVLDIAIRNGCNDARALWDAALGAFNLDLWRRTLSYLDAYEKIVNDNHNVNYFRAIALHELKKFKQAITAIERGVKADANLKFTQHALGAMSEAELGHKPKARMHLQAALEIPLSQDGGLGPSGLWRMFYYMRKAAEAVKADKLREQIVARALTAGLLSQEYFDEIRLNKGNKVADNLRAWEITLDQPLPKDWSKSPDCPSWTADWDSYLVTWLVLESSEEAAVKAAMAEQAKCHGLKPKLVSATAPDTLYNDQPGILHDNVREGKPRK